MQINEEIIYLLNKESLLSPKHRLAACYLVRDKLASYKNTELGQYYKKIISEKIGSDAYSSNSKLTVFIHEQAFFSPDFLDKLTPHDRHHLMLGMQEMTLDEMRGLKERVLTVARESKKVSPAFEAAFKDALDVEIAFAEKYLPLIDIYSDFIENQENSNEITNLKIKLQQTLPSLATWSEALKANAYVKLHALTEYIQSPTLKSYLESTLTQTFKNLRHGEIILTKTEQGSLVTLMKSDKDRWVRIGENGLPTEDSYSLKNEQFVLNREEQNSLRRCARGIGDLCHSQVTPSMKTSLQDFFAQIVNDEMLSRLDAGRFAKLIRELKSALSKTQLVDLLNEFHQQFDGLISTRLSQRLLSIERTIIDFDPELMAFSPESIAPDGFNLLDRVLANKKMSELEGVLLTDAAATCDHLPQRVQLKLSLALKERLKTAKSNEQADLSLIEQLDTKFIQEFPMYGLLDENGQFTPADTLSKLTDDELAGAHSAKLAKGSASYINTPEIVITQAPISIEAQWVLATTEEKGLSLVSRFDQGKIEPQSGHYFFVVVKTAEHSHELRLVASDIVGGRASLTDDQGALLTGELRFEKGTIKSWTAEQGDYYYIAERIDALPHEMKDWLSKEKFDLALGKDANIYSPVSLSNIGSFRRVEMIGEPFTPHHLLYANSLQSAANRYNTVIGLRLPNKIGQLHLKEGHPSKNFHVKAKSSNMGPTAGFIALETKYSKVKPAGWEKQRATIDKALAAGAKAVDLTLSPAQLQQVLDLKLMQKVRKEHYVSVYHGQIEQFIIGEDRIVRDDNRNPIKVLTNPPESDGSTSIEQPITADYDLLSIIAKQSQSDNLRPLEVGHKIAIRPRRGSFQLQEKIKFFSEMKSTSNTDVSVIDPDKGNFHQFGNAIINHINKKAKEEGYQGGKIVWHGDEFGNPFSEGFDPDDAPIFFIPGQRPQQIRTFEQFKAFHAALKKAGYAPEFNPRFNVS